MFFVELENLRDLLLYLLSRKKLWVLQPSQLHQVVQGARISLHASGGPNNPLGIIDVPVPVICCIFILLYLIL